MTITPFLTLRLRGKKDALHARQTARRVASLLSFSPHEQACIAGGVFVIACQALPLFGKAKICFQIEGRQLHVFAQGQQPTPPDLTNRITDLLRGTETQPLYRLSRPLPAEQSHDLAEQDLGWLVQQIEATAAPNLFEEIAKQNQDVLMLLAELRLCRANSTEKEDNFPNPHAA